MKKADTPRRWCGRRGRFEQIIYPSDFDSNNSKTQSIISSLTGLCISQKYFTYRSVHIFKILFQGFYAPESDPPHKIMRYSPFPRRWDSKSSTKCKSKWWILRRFWSTSQNRETQISQYLTVQIRIEILIGFEFLWISRYKFKLRFWFNLNLQLAKISPQFRISICISLIIWSLILSGRAVLVLFLNIVESWICKWPKWSVGNVLYQACTSSERANRRVWP